MENNLNYLRIFFEIMKYQPFDKRTSRWIKNGCQDLQWCLLTTPKFFSALQNHCAKSFFDSIRNIYDGDEKREEKKLSITTTDHNASSHLCMARLGSPLFRGAFLISVTESVSLCVCHNF